MKDHEEKLTQIATLYGIKCQTQKAIEECNELAVALAHGNRREIISEVADVKIMIEQLEILFDIHQEVEQEVEYKINRTITSIEKRAE